MRTKSKLRYQVREQQLTIDLYRWLLAEATWLLKDAKFYEGAFLYRWLYAEKQWNDLQKGAKKYNEGLFKEW